MSFFGASTTGSVEDTELEFGLLFTISTLIVIVSCLVIALFCAFVWPHVMRTPLAHSIGEVACDCHKRPTNSDHMNSKLSSLLLGNNFKSGRRELRDTRVATLGPVLNSMGEAEVRWSNMPSAYKLEVKRFEAKVKATSLAEAMEDDYISANLQGLPQKTTGFVNPIDNSRFVTQGFDYYELAGKIGSSVIDEKLLDQFELLSGRRPHFLLRRGVVFSHRDFDKLLTLHTAGKPFYLHLNIGSFKTMHLGHYIIFSFTKWLQEVFRVPLIIQVSEGETFLWKNSQLEECQQRADGIIKDIIAIGFDSKRTFIFTDFNYIASSPDFYHNMVKIQRSITYREAKKMFAFSDTSNLGLIVFPAVQAVPAFNSSFPQILDPKTDANCLIVSALDREPYFKLTREVASSLGYRAPAVLYTKFLPSLLGVHSKMSSSQAKVCISINISESELRNKILQQMYVDERQENLKANVALQYLTFFLPDDDLLESIKLDAMTGKMKSLDLKELVADILEPIVRNHSKSKAAITKDIIKDFTTPHRLIFPSHHND